MFYKKALVVAEHILLITLIAGAVGFYFGNQYGKGQVDIKALTTAQNTPQQASK